MLRWVGERLRTERGNGIALPASPHNDSGGVSSTGRLEFLIESTYRFSSPLMPKALVGTNPALWLDLRETVNISKGI